MTEKQPKFRSPHYPSMPLDKAIERTKQLREVAKGYPVPLSTAAKAWGFSEKSSAITTVAASLNQFGLIDDEGARQNRRIKVSELGESIILDIRHDSEARKQAIQKAALSPTVFREIWEQFSSVDIDENTLIYELTLGRKNAGKAPFSETAAADVAKVYPATLSFAGFSDDDTRDQSEDANPEGEDSGELEIKIGDRIQWTSDGVNQFENPVEVAAISDDGRWLWTSASKTAIPISQVSVIKVKTDNSLQTPPDPPPGLFSLEREFPKIDDTKFEEKKSLDEGEAVLIWPKSLSQDSVEDVEYWLQGVLRQMKRRAGKS